MAHIVEGEHIVPVWVEACNFLDNQPNYRHDNLILQINHPTQYLPEEHAKIAEANRLLKACDCHSSIRTVSGTIFPTSVYRRYGRPDFYERYHDIYDKGKKPGTWGTYFERMTRVPSRRDAEYINPLDDLVNKIKNRIDNDQRILRSFYELGITNVEEDLGFEIPIYEPNRFRNVINNMPCLSHLSFKLLKNNDVFFTNMTAVYRSHYYASKTLGNLIGLSELLSFVASESGTDVGTLTCVSTDAKLDHVKLGGKRSCRALLNNQMDIVD